MHQDLIYLATSEPENQSHPSAPTLEHGCPQCRRRRTARAPPATHRVAPPRATTPQSKSALGSQEELRATARRPDLSAPPTKARSMSSSSCTTPWRYRVLLHPRRTAASSHTPTFSSSYTATAPRPLPPLLSQPASRLSLSPVPSSHPERLRLRPEVLSRRALLFFLSQHSTARRAEGRRAAEPRDAAADAFAPRGASPRAVRTAAPAMRD
jgi:hypothetical protein